MKVDKYFFDALPPAPVMHQIRESAHSITLNSEIPDITEVVVKFDERGWIRLGTYTLLSVTLVISSAWTDIEQDWPKLKFTRVQLLLNHNVIDTQPLFTGEVMSRFLNAPDHVVKHPRRWEFALHFSLLTSDNVLPYAYFSVFSLQLIHPDEELAQKYDWACKLQTTHASLSRIQWEPHVEWHNEMSKRAIFQMNVEMFDCSEPKRKTSFLLPLKGASPGLCLAFFNDSNNLEKNVVKRLLFSTYDKYPLIIVEDATLVYGKNPQFPRGPPRPRLKSTPTLLNTTNTTPFPVEIWAIIFSHLDNGPDCERLRCTCKYLWKISHHDLIADEIYRISRANLPGWYFIPFNSLPVQSYQGPTVDLSKLELNLEMEFHQPFSGQFVVFWLNYNNLYYRNGCYAVQFS